MLSGLDMSQASTNIVPRTLMHRLQFGETETLMINSIHSWNPNCRALWYLAGCVEVPERPLLGTLR